MAGDDVEDQTKADGDTVRVEPERCTGCGDCVLVCPVGGLVLDHGKVAPAPGIDCAICGACESVCPVGAIGIAYEVVLQAGGRSNGTKDA